MSRFRVLHFVDGGAVYGGAVSFLNTVEQLRAQGHDVETMVNRGRPLGPILRERGFTVHECAIERKLDPSEIKRLARFFLDQRYDLVHTHLSLATLNGSLAGRKAGIPVVSHVHGMNLRLTYSFATHLVTVSEAARKHLMRQWVSGDRISVVYNGLEFPDKAALPTREEAREALGLALDAPVIGTIARVHWQKGYRAMLGAIERLRGEFPDLRYVVAGKGKHFDEIQKAAAPLGETVQFLGLRDDVPTILQALDVFAMPTLKEAMGISFVEAMGQGVPCVGTTVGGVPEVLGEGAGLLVPPNQAAPLAEALGLLLRDPASRARVGAAGEARARERFSRAASGAALEAVYRRVLGVK